MGLNIVRSAVEASGGAITLLTTQHGTGYRIAFAGWTCTLVAGYASAMDQVYLSTLEQ